MLLLVSYKDISIVHSMTESSQGFNKLSLSVYLLLHSCCGALWLIIGFEPVQFSYLDRPVFRWSEYA